MEVNLISDDAWYCPICYVVYPTWTLLRPGKPIEFHNSNGVDHIFCEECLLKLIYPTQNTEEVNFALKCSLCNYKPSFEETVALKEKLTTGGKKKMAGVIRVIFHIFNFVLPWFEPTTYAINLYTSVPFGILLYSECKMDQDACKNLKLHAAWRYNRQSIFSFVLLMINIYFVVGPFGSTPLAHDLALLWFGIRIVLIFLGVYGGFKCLL